MTVKCPFCKERVDFSHDGVCPACNGELSDGQLESMNRAIQKKKNNRTLTCEMCGEKNHPDSEECVSCGEAFVENAKRRGETGGIWRKGKLLVFEPDTIFPDICIKTNQPANGNRVDRTLVWFPIWSYLVGGVLLAFLFQKKEIVEFGISRLFQKKQKQGNWMAWGLSLSGIFLFTVVPVFLVQMDNNEQTYGIIAVVAVAIGLLSLLGGILIGNFTNYRLQATKITDDYIFLKGVHIDFVNRFPKWDGG